MTFGQPLWFWAFALLPLVILFFARNEARREKLLRQLVAARLHDRLAGSVSLSSRRVRFMMLLLALAGLIVSLAQPRWGYTMETSKRKGRDVIVAVDCSRSMLATDVSPSRLARAKLAVQDLVGHLQGDRLGLVAFAGSAFLQAPLTVDYGAVLNTLGELDTEIIPRGGTNIAAAVKQAVEAFGKGESDHRCLIIFTDGEELDADGIAAAAAQKDSIRIFTVGLGSADGSLIPIPGQGGGTAFVKDESGQIVKSRLDEDRLRKIAEVTGGFYVHLLNGPAEMQQIVRTGLGQMKEQEIDARMSRRPIERYQWPLGASLALLVCSALIGERKRVARLRSATAAAAALLLLGLLSSAAEAKNPGLEAYDRQDYKGAMEEFGRQLQRRPDSPILHYNMGAAAYDAGDFGKALESFAKATTSSDPKLRADAEYNLGNTFFQRGKAAKEKEGKIHEWKDALRHYDESLRAGPRREDAEYNREVVRKMIEEAEKEPPKSEQQQQQQPQENKDDQKKDEQNPSQSQSGQNKDQEQKDQEQKQDQKSQSQDQQKDQQQEQKSGEGKKQDQKETGSQEQKDQQSPSQENKDGKNDPKQQQDAGKGDQKKDAKEDPKQTGQDQPMPQQQGQKGEQQPTPSDEQSEKKRAGEIQAQNAPPPPDPQQEAAQEAAAEAQAAAEGRMTEMQARALLESLKGEDEKVQLLKPGERKQGRAFRDW